jgi:hypothetical protein
MKFYNRLEKFIIIISVLFVTIFYAPFNISSFGAKAHPNLTLYTMTTDEDVTIAWDDTNIDLTDFFDFYMWNYGELQKYIIGRTQQLRVTIKLPRTGLYIFYVRTCDKPESDTTRECSIYAHSNLVDAETGVPYGNIEDPANPGTYIKGKWMIYGHVAPPTGGGVVTTP